MANALATYEPKPLTPLEKELMKTPEGQKAALSDPNPRELRPVFDSAGHLRFEAEFNPETVNLIDFYGKRYFSRAMLRELGYTEFGQQLMLTVAGLHDEHVSEEFSAYKSGRVRRYTMSFQECGTRLVMNAGNRRHLMSAMPSGTDPSYLARPHVVSLFAGETEDGKGAAILRVLEVATDEVLKKRADSHNADLYGFGDDE